MSFGGGSFVTQNKVLPGVYVNIAAGAKTASALADRGVAALGVELSWGTVGELIYLTESEFRQESQSKLGYAYTDDCMKGLRDLFKHAAACYLYRLGGGAAAANAYGKARYAGVRGNDLSVAISALGGNYTVVTLLDGVEVDSQTVASVADLQDNDFVCWDKQADLAATAGTPFVGGTDAAASINDYQQMFTALEGVQFNTLGCLSTDTAVKALFVQFTREQREDSGRRFQTVLYREAADYEGVISLENQVVDDEFPESALVYWLVGAEAGCAVNASLTNARYDGEFKVIPIVGQSSLQAALQQGKLVFHQFNEQVKVLEDINSLVSGGAGEDMRFNQTVRVLDQIVGDLSNLFYEKYLGVVLNDNAGRVSLWNDIVAYYRKLEGLRAIEGFAAEDIIVEPGESKKAVKISSYLTVVNAMSQLYLTVTFE